MSSWSMGNARNMPLWLKRLRLRIMAWKKDSATHVKEDDENRIKSDEVSRRFLTFYGRSAVGVKWWRISK